MASNLGSRNLDVHATSREISIYPSTSLRHPNQQISTRTPPASRAPRPVETEAPSPPRQPSNPCYESDALQVAAYLIALRATAKDATATFGYLRYATGTFRVGLTRELEERIHAIVDAIRAGRSAATINRSHSIVQRCVNCSVRAHCDEALG